MKQLVTNSETILVQLNELKPHPFCEKIYKVNDLDLLKKSLLEEGQQQEILIDKLNRIVSGVRRWNAALEIGMTEMRCRVIDNLKEEQVKQLIISCNQQRKKTIVEELAEAKYILGILGLSQGKKRTLLGKEDDPEFGNIGKDRFGLAAKYIGTDKSPSTLRRLIAIDLFEEEIPDNNLNLIDKINNGGITIGEAYKLMKKYRERLTSKPTEIPIISINKSDKYKLYNKSSLHMDEVVNGSVSCTITSFPYYQLRKYSNSETSVTIPELGLENTPEEYIENCVAHLEEIKRKTKPTGSIFINLADTYNKSESYLITLRFLIAACDRVGLFLVNEIIWSKINTLPQAAEKRLTPSYEKIFHFVLDPENYAYYPFQFDNKKMELYTIDRANKRGGIDKGKVALSKPYRKFKDFLDKQKVEDTIVSCTVIGEAAELGKIDPDNKHPAPFASTLVLLPILLTTKLDGDDIVLDPFAGSSTTLETAILLGRQGVGYEIQNRFCDLSHKRLAIAEKNINVSDMEAIQNQDRSIDITNFSEPNKKVA